MIHKRFDLKIILIFGLLFPACTASIPDTPTQEIPTLVVTPTRTYPPIPTSTQVILTPTIETVLEEHPTVFVISWDGAPAEAIDELLLEGELPTFESIASSGLRAAYAQTVDPSLTAAAQNSIASGSFPARTGIVSNIHHNPNDSFYWYRQDFDESMDKAEPVWVTTSRAGYITATAFFPGASLNHPSQTADFTIGYGVRDAYSRQEKIALEPAENWENIPNTYSPPLEGNYPIPQITRLHLLVLDTTDDQTENYDIVWINTERSINQETLSLQLGQWGSQLLLPNSFAGAEFLIQAITPEEITLYHTGVYHNSASPRALLENLNRKFGFYPAGADLYALEHGWITHEDYLYLLEQASLWMAEVTTWLYEAYQPDLLFTWQNNFDAAGHAFYLRDPLQPGYTPELAQSYAENYRRTARVSDQALKIMLTPLNLEHDTVMLVSDHGMSPVISDVYVNTVLENARLLVLDRRDYVVEEKSQAIAFASGGAMNVYINLSGREQQGIVSLEEYPLVQEKIIKLYTELQDPLTGKPVFQRVLAREELTSLGLNHPNSGDVFAQAYPGYNLDGWRGNDQVFSEPVLFGQHGYDCQHPDMQTIFIAAGYGIPSNGAVIPPVRVVDIAPTIADLLGFEPAPTVDGAPIALHNIP